MSRRPFILKSASCPRCREYEYVPYRDDTPCDVCNNCLEAKEALIGKLQTLTETIGFLDTTRAELKVRLKEEFLWEATP